MKKPHTDSSKRLPRAFTLALAGLASLVTVVRADISFLGVASGDASDTDVVVWTRATDDAAPGAAVSLTLEYSTDPTFTPGVSMTSATTTSAALGDNTAKAILTGLSPATRYYFRFAGGNVTSGVGTFKTAPDSSAAVPVRFAFSGDMDGLIRPYALSSTLPGQQLDFYLNCGDVIYETASNVKGNNGASYLNSPNVTLSGSSASLDGIPVGGTTFATHQQLFDDYNKKYREQFLPVNTGGQNGLKDFYAGQGNYTLSDNHELGNRQYINGGAPAGGSVGGPSGNDMPTGRGVDARAFTGTNTGGSGNVNNVNDANTSASDYMNRSQGFQTLQQVFLNYQPVKENRANPGLPSATLSTPADPRTDGTRQLFFAQPWGHNALYVQLDTRSYRDIRIKTANAGADDTGARADNPARSYLGATQLAWLEQTLLDAEQNGTPWKFVALSDPIDEIGPIAGALSSVTAAAMQPFSGNINYGPVNADGGKSFVGGYRAERNALLKFIADNRIRNVVFLATDDHQNRINEVTYSPSGRTGPGSDPQLGSFAQSDYMKVPYTFSIVCGPLGATGPDLFLNHDWTSVQGAANLIANAQSAAGVETIGLVGYPGLHDVQRDQNGVFVSEAAPQAADFYSPDSFNYNILDVSGDGKTLSVTSVGINSTAQNSALEYDAITNPARTLFSFEVDAAVAPHFTTCPENVTVPTDNGQCSALLGFVAAADGFPAPTVTCTLNGIAISSPFNFPKGVSTVTCVASSSDLYGTETDTCSFTVTVNDTEAPVTTTVKKKDSNRDDDDAYYVLQATDNCDGGNLQIFVKDSSQGDCGGSFSTGPYAPGTKVQLSCGGKTPSVKRGSDGLAARIRTVGNPVLIVTDSSGNTSCTKVVVPRED